MRVWVMAAIGIVSCVSARTRALDWDLPSECMSRDDFETALALTLGVELEEIAASVSAQRVEGGWIADVRVDVDQRHRERSLSVDHPDCHRLNEGLVLVTALLIDEIAETERNDTSRTLAIPPPLDRERWTGVARMAAVARIDSLPGFFVGPAVEVEITPPSAWPILLGLTVFPGGDSLDANGRGARVSATGVVLGTCPVLFTDSVFELGACAAVSWLGISAVGLGLDLTAFSFGSEVSALGEVMIRFAIARPLWMRVGLGAGVSILRARIFFDDGAMDFLVHETAPVFPIASVGLEFRLSE